MSAGSIAEAIPDITFGAVSQHLGVLLEAGVLDVRREGKYRFYRTNQNALGPLASYLSSMWVGQLNNLKALAEDSERRHGRTKRN